MDPICRRVTMRDGHESHSDSRAGEEWEQARQAAHRWVDPAIGAHCRLGGSATRHAVDKTL
jgi:hypothetical protein